MTEFKKLTPRKRTVKKKSDKFTWTWHIVVGLATLITIIVGIVTIDDRYATGKDLDRLEQKTVQTLDQFSKEQDQKYMMQRYDALNDLSYKYKALEKAHPNDQNIKQDLRRIEDEKAKLRQQLKIGY
jgi:hypothetical protein